MAQLFEELMELNGQPQFNMVSETEFGRCFLWMSWSGGNDPKYLGEGSRIYR